MKLKKKPWQTIKNRLMTASNSPLPLDGSLCSKEINSLLHISEIIIFPGICVPGALSSRPSTALAVSFHQTQMNCVRSEDVNLMSNSISICKRITICNSPYGTSVLWYLSTRNQNETDLILQRALANSWMVTASHQAAPIPVTTDTNVTRDKIW